MKRPSQNRSTLATPLAAVAVDLMDSLSTRERSAGIRVLTELLHG